MKGMFSYLILIILVFKSNSLLPPEKREELMNKYTRKITFESFNSNKDSFNSYNVLKDGFDYDPKQITAILELYGFHQNYSFLEEHKITANVKDQGGCGCCWSHSVTTALAYRFKLKNLDIDLSPQDALSCYLRDCDYGNYLIDPQLNLIKNGTVTEQCLPFSSSEGVITDDCPVKCKDGSDIKKYYSQNAYKTEETVTQTNFYDIVLLIIDQLVNKGPVVAGITVYEDFVDLSKDQAKCKNTVYRYNGKAEESGGHAVAVVGYGYWDGKYYWLIQNSWGPYSCDGGFIKVEFGQIGVEDVAFGEPYLEEEGKDPAEIKFNYNKMDGNCNIELSLENTADIEKWKNSLEFKFQTDDGRSNFNFQCGILSSVKVNKKIACYYEYLNLEIPAKINFFKYKGFQSLGKDNTFSLGSSSSQIKDFNFYGFYTFYPYVPAPGQYVNEQTFFVSEEGSKIILYLDDVDADKDYLPPIYANSKAQTPLSDCERKILVTGDITHNLIICNIKSNEVDYFGDNYPEKDSMSYSVLCGAKEEINTYAYKLDKTKYPIFRVKGAYLEKTMNLTSKTGFSFDVEIEGNTENFNQQYFAVYAEIEYNNKNETYTMMCQTGTPGRGISETNMTCEIQIGPQEGEKNYTNLYVYPYYYNTPLVVYSPYEIIMKDVIKKENEFNPKPDPGPDPGPGPEPDPSTEPKPTGFSNSLKSSLILMLVFILLL